MNDLMDGRRGKHLLAAAVIAGAAVMAAANFAPAYAQPAHPGPQPATEGGRGNAPAAEPAGRPRAQNDNAARLPADSVTDQTVELPGRTLHFKATAGSIPLNDAESGALQAEIAYVAYVMGSPADNRPVTFLFNGGPGAASAYLDIGAVGPWRLPLDNITSSTSPALGPNAETWLDFTDLVFIDPVGTGYSRIAASGDNVRRQFYSVDGDANALAVIIRKWIEKTGRQSSVKFVVGESYGGFRVPKVARALTGPGRRHSRAGDDLAGARLRDARQPPARSDVVGGAPAVDGRDRARGQGTVRPRPAARGRELRVRRLSARSPEGREGRAPRSSG